MQRARDAKSFRVVLCLCPPERSEKRAEPRASIRVIGTNRVTVDTGRGHRAHVLDFDAVWNEGTSPQDIYESTTKSLVEYVMKGYNGCVILYGQFTSGETHPIQVCTARQRGIISRAAEDIFNSPEASHCRIRVSSYHISNEKIYDLLEPQVSEVCRFHDSEEAVLLEGLRELEVGSAQELLDVYNSGIAHRNAGVSRGDFASKSHMVLNIMVINMRGKLDKEGVLTASKLTLVDLASSGKPACNTSAVLDIKRGFHVAQENLQEAKTIKRSLTIFRNVIFSLSNPGTQHIPYRESKLTRVLRDCLGGNCRTCLVVTMPSRSSSITETMSCLQFAAQALNVPSRTIHTSQIRYSPSQMQSKWTADKNSLLLPRTQILPPVSADRRSQASLPSIVTSPGPLSQLKPKRSLEVSESCSFLPHLEKSRPPESSGYHSCGSRITDEKSGAVDEFPRACRSHRVPLREPLSFRVPPRVPLSFRVPLRVPLSSSVPPRVPLCSSVPSRVPLRSSVLPRVPLRSSVPPRVPYRRLAAKGTWYPRLTTMGASYRRLAAKGTSYHRLAAKETSYRRLAVKGASYRRLAAKGTSYARLAAKGTLYRGLHVTLRVKARPQVPLQMTSRLRVPLLTKSHLQTPLPDAVTPPSSSPDNVTPPSSSPDDVTPPSLPDSDVLPRCPAKSVTALLSPAVGAVRPQDLLQTPAEDIARPLDSTVGVAQLLISAEGVARLWTPQWVSLGL